MDKQIKAYLQGLEAGDYQRLLALFAEGAVVYSPLYGQRSAPDFYRELLSDSATSCIRLRHAYHQGSARSAVYFIYEWTLADGSQVTFDCVDLFEWNAAGQITELRIIYDASRTRQAFERQQNQREA